MQQQTIEGHSVENFIDMVDDLVTLGRAAGEDSF
jgi:hypothetical protein